jgi:hypothetical protein
VETLSTDEVDDLALSDLTLSVRTSRSKAGSPAMIAKTRSKCAQLIAAPNAACAARAVVMLLHAWPRHPRRIRYARRRSETSCVRHGRDVKHAASRGDHFNRHHNWKPRPGSAER